MTTCTPGIRRATGDRIAELAVGGLTDKQIAAQLGMSARTVGAHLYRIFPSSGWRPGRRCATRFAPHERTASGFSAPRLP